MLVSRIWITWRMIAATGFRQVGGAATFTCLFQVIGDRITDHPRQTYPLLDRNPFKGGFFIPRNTDGQPLDGHSGHWMA